MAGDGGPYTTAWLLVINLSVFAVAIYAMVKDTIPTILEDQYKKWQDAMAVAQGLQDMFTNLEELEAHQQGAFPVPKPHTGTPQCGDGNSEGEEKVEESELDIQISRLFVRYDLDGSGTINSWDELEQLCCNLGYRLELELSPTRIDEVIEGVKRDNESIEWDLDEFSAWFKNEFKDSSQ
jgi:hypothetical protein